MTLLRRINGPAAVALGAFAAHVLVLSRYGFYRDELYFLVCAKHLAWGYADQPPLVALIAAGAAAAGTNMYVLRLLPALAAAGASYSAAAVCARLSGSRRAQTITAALVALMPAALFLGNTLTTTSFDPLLWTLIVLSALALRERWNAGWFTLLMLAGVCGAYAKYSIFLPLAASALAFALLRETRAAARIVLAAMLAAAALTPNLVWQAQHGFPMLDVLAGDVSSRHAFNSGFTPEYAGLLQNAAVFLALQFVVAGVFAAPVVLSAFRQSRFVSLTAAAIVAAAVIANAKVYYIAGLYPTLIAAGCAFLFGLPSRLRAAIAAVAISGGLLTAPLFLPLLPPLQHFPNPLLADEFGWDSLTRSVASAYGGLPQAERNQVTLYADTYGDAAALEIFGPRYGLPQPVSAQNQYFLWGRRGSDLHALLAVGASQYRVLKRAYGSVRQIAVYRDEYRWAAEGPTPIYLCTLPRARPDEIWHMLRWFGA